MANALQSATAVIDSAGEARVTVGPMVYGTRWKISRFTTSSNSTNQTRLTIYQGFEGGSVVDFTVIGNNNASEVAGNMELQAGETLVWVWINGSPGAQCTATVFGEQVRR